MKLSIDAVRISLLVFGNALVYAFHIVGWHTFPIFLLLYIGVFFACQPSRVLSPLTMLYIYYGAWFVFAPTMASLYAGQLGMPEYRLSFAFAFSVYSVAALAIHFGERAGLATSPIHLALPDVSESTVVRLAAPLYAMSTAAIFAIILGSGGFETWLRNPGDAFLNRAGTGVYVIISHFSSLALAMLTGFLAYRWRRYGLLALFFAWVAVTSPVHGSKMQIMLLLILSLTPWLVTSRFWSWKLFALLGAGVAVFIVGMYFRHQSILSSWGMVMSTANYFTALHNLAVSIRDFDPGLLTTFFMPLNKIWMTMGWMDPSSYFDMNHMLTDIYRPDAWAIRATEQWPVETDLYLNFYFVGGLPLIAVFFFLHGWLFGFARRVNSVGAWFAAVMLTVSMLSHLRGSLYNHVDFYMYPYILFVMTVMGGWKMGKSEHIAPVHSAHRTLIT
ncbi:O-antigen polymerase [Agrobacterium albertimagni AOL15]|uniref:O-antigen polymerase n=1 Tax=Agrobacterium albertimagni AOL15 TaxID=1156935 RepID=K2Q6U0_9HYPH|nr:hypothetical protein [Agrobacterium albertimagni]EKF59369.1 O-antigen polymerase [Agrobacterium albertimagni AOL15]